MATLRNTGGVWVAAAALGWLLAIGCGGGSDKATSGEPPPQGAATPPADSSAATASAPAAGAPANVTEIFPQGPGREQVISTCGSCHNVACSAIGQRTNGRWDGLQEGHAGRVADEDLKAAFEYLKANFNEAKPEPKVPPEFLQGGCTPPG